MSNWQSEVIAITGTIGSGKTTFVELLKKMGAFTVSADDLAKEVVEPGSKGLAQVIALFGEQYLTSEGTLDRKKLGKLVFSDPQKRKALENVLHPLIAVLAEERFKDPKAQGKLKVYDCPLFFEAGLDKRGFKKKVVVAANPEVCLTRIMHRDGVAREEALKKLANQWPIEQKIKNADLVIDNSSTVARLEEAARDLMYK